MRDMNSTSTNIVMVWRCLHT